MVFVVTFNTKNKEYIEMVIKIMKNKLVFLKNKNNSDLCLLIIFILSVILCITYIITIDIPEIMIGPIHGGEIFNFIYQIAIGYIVSYLLYLLIKSLFDKKDIQLKRELLKYIYRSTIKRLTECTTEIEMKYQFIDVVKDKTFDFDYLDSLFSAFEHTEEGLKGLKLLHEIMSTIDLETYAKARNKPDLPYYTSLSHIAVEIYESDLFKKNFFDITMNLIPQILLCEPDYDIKQIVHRLRENIEDIREIINGQNEMNTQATFPHLVRFVEHTISLYEILLKKGINLENSYQT